MDLIVIFIRDKRLEIDCILFYFKLDLIIFMDLKLLSLLETKDRKFEQRLILIDHNLFYFRLDPIISWLKINFIFSSCVTKTNNQLKFENLVMCIIYHVKPTYRD